MIEAYKKFWKNAFNFKGRSTRADFWYVMLANFIIGFVLGFVDGLLGITVMTTIATIYSFVCIIPSLALEVRRMHDVNKSGWYLLMSFIPLVGWIFVLVAYCTASVEPNKYGQNA